MSLKLRSVIAMSLVLILIGTIPIVLGEDDGRERDPETEREAQEGRGARTRIDRDGDGYISYREFYARFSDRYDENTLKRIFNAADADDDDQLTKREAMKAGRLLLKVKVEKIKAERVKNMNYGRMKNGPDADGDGALTLREFHSFINGRLDDATVKRIFNAADADGDGELDLREQKKAYSLLKDLVKDRVKERIEKKIDDVKKRVRNKISDLDKDQIDLIKRIINGVDANGDGVITARELHQMIKRIKRVMSA